MKALIELELKLLDIMLNQAFNSELTRFKTVQKTASPNEESGSTIPHQKARHDFIAESLMQQFMKKSINESANNVAQIGSLVPS